MHPHMITGWLHWVSTRRRSSLTGYEDRVPALSCMSSGPQVRSVPKVQPNTDRHMILGYLAPEPASWCQVASALRPYA